MTHNDHYERLHLRFTEMEVPRCTCCGGSDTASVQAGVIGLTIRLAATCRKFKLIGNGPKPGEWFCHGCESFFDTWAPCSPGEQGQTDGGIRPRSPFVRFDFPPGARPGEIAEAINAMRAKHREQKEEKDEP